MDFRFRIVKPRRDWLTNRGHLLVVPFAVTALFGLVISPRGLDIWELFISTNILAIIALGGHFIFKKDLRPYFESVLLARCQTESETSTIIVKVDDLGGQTKTFRSPDKTSYQVQIRLKDHDQDRLEYKVWEILGFLDALEFEAVYDSRIAQQTKITRL